MDINNVYIAKVYNIVNMCWDFKNYPTLRVKEEKSILIYIKTDEFGDKHYIDLETGDEYYTYNQLKKHKDAISYIDIQYYPTLSQELGIKGNNMSKRRILKKYKKEK